MDLDTSSQTQCVIIQWWFYLIQPHRNVLFVGPFTRYSFITQHRHFILFRCCCRCCCFLLSLFFLFRFYEQIWYIQTYIPHPPLFCGHFLPFISFRVWCVLYRKHLFSRAHTHKIYFCGIRCKSVFGSNVVLLFVILACNSVDRANIYIHSSCSGPELHVHFSYM